MVSACDFESQGNSSILFTAVNKIKKRGKVMKIDEILKLVNAGYSKEEITALDTSKEQKQEQQEQKQEQKNEGTFDYDKFAASLVKAQQLANGRNNFGGSSDKTDISRFF